MANVTRATLAAERDSNFPTNNTNQITAVDLRDWLTDGIDSFLTQKDKSIMEEVIWEARSNALTAGGTTDLSSANGNFVHIQGSSTIINSFGICNSGARFILVFDGVYTLDYDATQLILPGSANITTAANDCCMIVSEGSGNWRVIGYFPIAGGSGGGTVTAVTATSPLSSTGGNAPDISIQQATTSQNGYLTSTDWNTFNGKQDALSAGTGISLASNTVTNTAPDQVVALTPGTGISTSGTYPNFTIANTAPDQTVALTPGTGIGITGTYPNFTIANTSPSSGGTVTSIATSSPITGGPITGSGTIGIQDAAADGTTKGAATFAASDFNATTGVISIDYTNGQKASGSQDGFLSSGNWTTFNNKVSTGAVTGSGLTMATSRLLGRTSAASPGAIEEITVGSGLSLSGGSLSATGSGSGTVNSGTANRLTYYAATGTSVSELPTAGSAGQILQSNGTGSAPSWVNAPAATLTIGTSIVSGATAGRVLLTTTSGANQVLNQDSNLNYDTTNDRLGIGVASPAARVDLAAGTAANGQILLAPSTLGSAGLTGTTDGTMWYDTTSNNSSIYLRKLYAAATSILTKLITLDRNPDLAIGSTNGVVISDANGSLSKSADLTALGIYAQTNTITAITSGTNVTLLGTLTGSATLSANFFGVGKTIEIYCAGVMTTGSSPTITISPRLTDGTTTVAFGTFTYNTQNVLAGSPYWLRVTITNRTTGANPQFGIFGEMRVNHATKDTEVVFINPGGVTMTGLNTSSALTLQLVTSITGTGNSIDSSINYANYKN